MNKSEELAQKIAKAIADADSITIMEMEAVILPLLEPYLKGEWQPIGTAPKGTTEPPVLLGSVECEIVSTGYADFIDNLCTDGHEPTHWMPLPDPPKESSK